MADDRSSVRESINLVEIWTMTDGACIFLLGGIDCEDAAALSTCEDVFLLNHRAMTLSTYLTNYAED